MGLFFHCGLPSFVVRLRGIRLGFGPNFIKFTICPLATMCQVCRLQRLPLTPAACFNNSAKYGIRKVIGSDQGVGLNQFFV